MDGPAKGRGTPPAPRKLEANTTGVDSPSQSKSSRGSLVHSGNTPSLADSTTTHTYSLNTMQSNARVIGSPLTIAPSFAKLPNTPTAQNHTLQPSSTVSTPQSQGLKRTASRMAEDKISKYLGELESKDSGDDKNGSQFPNKRVRVDREYEERIGCHVDAPDLAIYASYKNALALRIHPEEATPEVVAKFQSKLGKVVTIEKVILDAKIFGRPAEDLEALGSEQKKRLIKNLLKSKEDNPVKSGEGEGNMKTSSVGVEPDEVLVGSMMKDSNPLLNDVQIPVYASLSSHKPTPHVKYRMDKKAADASKIQLDYRMHPLHNQIDFLPDFQKNGSSEEKVKEEIRSILSKEFRKNHGDDSNVKSPTAESTNEHGTIVVGNGGVGDQLIQAMRDHEKTGEDLRKAVLEYHELCTTQYEPAINKHSEQLCEKDKTITRLERETEIQDATINKHVSTITEKDHKIEGMDTIIRNQNTKIASLVEQVKQLTAQVRPLAKSRLNPQNDKLEIDGQAFSKFPVGDANEGLYVSKQGRVVTVGDIDYNENTALSEFKNIELGGKLADSITSLNGVPFKLISGGSHSGKLIQELGPHSVFHHNGKHYIRWLIRTEKTLSL